MPPILELRNVSYRIGGRRIVNDASWSIRRGEHWAILGPNGAGKTTLLRLACGYLWPNDGGVVLRNGEEAVNLRELRRSIGWVSSLLAAAIPQDEPVLDTVVSGRFGQTGLMRMAWDLPTAEDYADARQQLANLQAAELADRTFGVLSQGEQQRVLIARANMAHPLLLVLDEPCVALDPGSRETFLQAIQQLAARPDSPSLVMVTHRLEEIMPAFQFLFAMHEGRIVASGRRDELELTPLLEKLYGVAPAELLDRGGRIWPIY